MMKRNTWLHFSATALAGMASAALAVSLLATPIAAGDRGMRPPAPPEAGEPANEERGSATEPGESANITVEGKIEAAKRDATSGKATAVQITDPNGGSFLIANEGKGKELISHVGKSATVTGRVVREGFRKVLEVEDYQLVKG